jgi:hypothetical protein
MFVILLRIRKEYIKGYKKYHLFYIDVEIK